MSRPAACLFDLDGLLLDTEPLHGRAWRQAAREFGLELSDQQLLALRGRRRLDNASRVIGWIGAAGRQPPTSEQLLAVQQPIARQLLPGARAMPGAPELVRRCQELAIPMALATSSSHDSVGIKCAPHPWLELIELIVCGDDPELAAGKPAPDIFLLAARRLGWPLAPAGPSRIPSPAPRRLWRRVPWCTCCSPTASGGSITPRRCAVCALWLSWSSAVLA